MLCPNCQHQLNPGASFCGNCGYRLGPDLSQSANLPASTQNVPTHQTVALPVKDTSKQAILAFVLGALGCVGWLIPIIGVILGVLAIIFGSMSQHSRHKTLSTIGIILGTLVTLVSIFFWVGLVENALKASPNSSEGANSSLNSNLQAISTPCYTTKIPINLKVNKTNGNCTFSALSDQTGEEYEVKVVNVPKLTPSNLQQAAVSDASTAISSTPGGSIYSQNNDTFAGNPAYKFILKATDGSAGTIDYVYKATAQGNLVIILHIKTNGQNYNLSSIEKYWFWQ